MRIEDQGKQEDGQYKASIVKFENPQDLKRERDNKVAASKAHRIQKLSAALDTCNKTLRTWTQWRDTDPASMFENRSFATIRTTDGAAAGQAVPTHDTLGNKLSKTLVKKLTKEQAELVCVLFFFFHASLCQCTC